MGTYNLRRFAHADGLKALEVDIWWLYYKALMMEKAEEYHRVLMGVLAEEDDVLTVLEDYIATKARLFTDSLTSLRLYFAETRGASFNIKAGLDQDIRKLYDKFVMRLASVLEAGVRKKVFRKIDPYYMAVALERLTNAFLFCWLEDRSGIHTRRTSR